MATVQPKGERVQQAVKWISERIKYEEDRTLAQLIPEAASQFNLSPKDEEFLTAFYRKDPID